MSKKAIVNEIKDKLHERGIKGCQALGSGIVLSNGNKIAWVGYRQILMLIRDKVYHNTYRAKRFQLYSKDVDIEMLTLIRDKLNSFKH